MSFAYLLPAGSVVVLKGTERPVMINGVRQRIVSREGEAIIRDYIAVPYPEGRISESIQFAFSHEDIGEVLFMGYDGPERAAFLKMLEEVENNRIQIT